MIVSAYSYCFLQHNMHVLGYLKLDYDSYDRRYKGEVSKDPNSAATLKLTKKLDNTRVKLTEITDDIKEHFEAFERQRPSMLVSELSALVGIQHSLSSRNAALLSKLLPSVPHAAVSLCAMAHAREADPATDSRW